MAKQAVVIVTGANRGIGLAICEQVLQNHSPVKLYACSRAGADLALLSKTSSTSSTVAYPKLDITKEDQVKDFASHVKATDGTVDVLINNAGTNKYANDAKEADEIVEVNYRGTLRMCETFLPLISKQGRIVNVSSVASSLHNYNKDIQIRFRDPRMTIADIGQLDKEYVDAVAAGNVSKQGLGDEKGYCFSKVCVNALTATLARDNPGLTINCCCPGWVATDMGRIMGSPSKSPAEGAKIPIRLGFGNIDGITGKYWSNPGVNDTGDGKVMTW